MVGEPTGHARHRARLAWAFPLLVLMDLMSAHAHDVPTVPPAYWTSPPESVRRIKADPGFIRVYGKGDKHSGEPGHASEPIDYLPGAMPWTGACRRHGAWRRRKERRR